MHCLKPTTQTARKKHWCYWCGETIGRSMKYVKWCFMNDGSANTIKVHTECHTAWRLALSKYPDYEDDVQRSEHCRGCSCQRGQCDCGNIDAAMENDA